MNQPSRNDPCPCGSGKKYKRCCLRREREVADAEYQRQRGPSIALDWLMDNYPWGVDEILQADFFGGLFEDEHERLADLPADFAEMVSINSAEWLLADGEIDLDADLAADLEANHDVEFDGDLNFDGDPDPDLDGAFDEGNPRLVRELLLEPGGPLFEVEQRRRLEQLFARSMGLYEVEESRPGEGLRLRDTLNREEPSSVWVGEKAGSRTLVRGDILGARLIPGEPVTLSGALYPIPRGSYLNLRAGLLEMFDHCVSEQEKREGIAFLIADAWLKTLVALPPEVVDRSTGEPILLVTDHYEVLDWDRLTSVLAEQSDVEGDWTGEWVRLESVEGGAKRLLYSLTSSKKGRVQLFARTLKLADGGRAWIEGLAPGTLEHRIREQVDPMSSRVGLDAPPAGRSQDQKLPPEEMTALLQASYEQLYGNWADEPVPFLGDLTPRQALADERQREAVIELIRTYEFGEDERARAEGREPASFAFLWRGLGLSLEEHSAES